MLNKSIKKTLFMKGYPIKLTYCSGILLMVPSQIPYGKFKKRQPLVPIRIYLITFLVLMSDKRLNGYFLLSKYITTVLMRTCDAVETISRSLSGICILLNKKMVITTSTA
jgi:hypothetical protein